MAKHINLLSKEKQKELMYEHWFFSSVRLTEIVVLTFLFVLVLQVGVWWYLRSYESSLVANIASIQQISNKEENAKLKAEVTVINNKINDFDNLLKINPYWSKPLIRVLGHLPHGVRIQALEAEQKEATISIRGWAPNREDVIAFHTAVFADQDYFTSIDYPLDNVSKPTDVNFHFTISVREDVLKP